ncbi:MAG: DMT family transporter [Oscillospiraceae bacterium]|nr:DMT family transporter [Oscillospiraceae bacterium]
MRIKKSSAARLTLVLTAIIWGAGFVFSQAALDVGFGPAGLMLVKFGLASVLVGIIFRRAVRRGFVERNKKSIRGAFILGVTLAFSFLAQTLGLMLSTPSNNALITAAYVVITPFLWRLAFRKKPHRAAYVASVICFIGVAALSLDFSGGLSFRAGDLWTLLCAVFFAGQIVATEALVGEMEHGFLLFIEITTAALTTLVLALVARFVSEISPGTSGILQALMVTPRDFYALITPMGIACVAFLGVLSTGLCYVMQTSAQRYVSSGAASIILSMEALFGAVFSVIIGYDELSPRLVLGGGLILASVMLGEIVGIRSARREGAGQNTADSAHAADSGANDSVHGGEVSITTTP